MFRFETLRIWQESLEYVDEVYLLTRKFPREEVFSLTSQLRRAAVLWFPLILLKGQQV